MFELAQHEMKKRKDSGQRTNGVGRLSSKIVCGECGSFYGSKVWHSTRKYRRTIWQCNHKFNNDVKCQTPHIYEAALEQAFMEAFNSLLANKNEILQGYESIIHNLTDTAYLDTEN